VTNNQPKSAFGNWLAVALIVWLLFFNGFSSLRALIDAGALSRAAGAIQTGAGRVTGPRTDQLPTVKPASPQLPGRATQPASQAAAEAQANAAYQATVQAVDAAQPPAAAAQQPAVVGPIGALPTAVIAIPTAVPVAQVVVVPQAMPRTYAQSGPMLPTPIPTMAYPTPLPAAAAAYSVSPDGRCVTAPRNGAQYQVCQGWPYKDAEARSVADYLRTGMIPGTKVE
jgi:hypothetical protein